MNHPGESLRTGTGRLTVTAVPLEEWRHVTQWADGEGWNVGPGDADCFHPTDPEGFFLARIGTTPVASLSVVNYSDTYAFMGHYLVHPDLRGQGLGLATWEAASPHAGRRAIGLDAALPQRDNYAKHGFRPAWDTVRYGGALTRPGRVREGTVRIGPAHLDAVAAYDRAWYPADRGGFVRRWLTAPGHVGHAVLRDGAVAGYGVIRPAPEGHRIGPLFADTPEDAEALLDTLTADLGPGADLSLDVPAPQTAGVALAEARGLTERFRTVRMYRGDVPPSRAGEAYATTTLELG
ncbi:GNAT family N-acetyltransferase [Streptomyces caatingaensis]|uniref:GCN5 family acetyltransferase n=1 Tax=Streptomyces caatingaensis TaxID=1678637 RepID=A0A0K9XHQ1_9ACTN|nr:GNAT family N-acetyltransferase [Streptomyces caatingaensis]KNB52803.1 GCN5 family acetyltransferase [Streptomyces caatingaensis]